jgi:hypothetical protein
VVRYWKQRKQSPPIFLKGEIMTPEKINTLCADLRHALENGGHVFMAAWTKKPEGQTCCSDPDCISNKMMAVNYGEFTGIELALMIVSAFKENPDVKRWVDQMVDDEDLNTAFQPVLKH